MVRRNRDSATQNLGFASRPFVLCGLPIKRPPKGILLHERRNGRISSANHGAVPVRTPWGQDRLVHSCRTAAQAYHYLARPNPHEFFSAANSRPMRGTNAFIQLEVLATVGVQGPLSAPHRTNRHLRGYRYVSMNRNYRAGRWQS